MKGPVPQAERLTAHDSAAAAAPAELHKTLVSVQSLVQNAIDRYGDVLLDESVIESTGDSAIARNVLSAEFDKARNVVCVILPHEPQPAEVVLDHLQCAAARWNGRVRVRLLASTALLSWERLSSYAEGLRRYGAGEAWLEVRTHQSDAPSAIVVDFTVALARLDRLGDAWRVSLVRDLTVVHAMHGLFFAVWQHGLPLESMLDALTPKCRACATVVIDHLLEGRTDELAARRMGVSVRTYRRYVADLMEALGAQSRFQAGVLAAEHGLARSGQRPG